MIDVTTTFNPQSEWRCLQAVPDLDVLLKMNLLKIIKKAWSYNIFDDFVENGATRIDVLPKDLVWLEKAQMFHIDNLTINYGVRGGIWIAKFSDSIVLANWKKEQATRLLVREIKENPDIYEHRSKIKRWWNKHNRPFLYGDLKVGFGDAGDRYVSEHPEFQTAEQDGAHQSTTRSESESE